MDPYDEGWEDARDGFHDNPYVELSLDWVEYEQGYDDWHTVQDENI